MQSSDRTLAILSGSVEWKQARLFSDTSPGAIVFVLIRREHGATAVKSGSRVRRQPRPTHQWRGIALCWFRKFGQRDEWKDCSPASHSDGRNEEQRCHDVHAGIPQQPSRRSIPTTANARIRAWWRRRPTRYTSPVRRNPWRHSAQLGPAVEMPVGWKARETIKPFPALPTDLENRYAPVKRKQRVAVPLLLRAQIHPARQKQPPLALHQFSRRSALAEELRPAQFIHGCSRPERPAFRLPLNPFYRISRT